MNVAVYLVAVLAVSCYGALSPLAKRLLPTVPPFSFISLCMVLLALFSAIAAFFYEKNFSVFKLTPADWRSLALFSLVNFAGFSMYLFALAKMPVVHYQLIGLLTPIVGGIIAYFLLGEALKPQYMAGLALIGTGLFVALRDWG